jgi:alpha-N-arabinofuranosidase
MYTVLVPQLISALLTISYLGIHIFYPQMIAALGEAVYLLGAEHNPNVVRLSSYAPLLQHRNSTQWTPNLISFEAQQSKTVLSASYWWQWLFGRFRGTQTLPIQIASGHLNPLFWGSTVGSDGEVYLKVSLTVFKRYEC